MPYLPKLSEVYLQGLSLEQDNVDEVEDIVKNAEEVDRVIARPVSPIFGTSQVC